MSRAHFNSHLRRALAGGVLLPGLLVLGGLGCGSSGDGGTGPTGRTAQFEPSPRDTTLGTLQVLRIDVRRSDNVAIPADFQVNGASDTTTTSFDFVSSSEGSFVVSARVTVDGVEFQGQWTVTVSDGAVPPTPRVQPPSATEGTIPGSIALEWQAPPSSQVPVPLTDYVIAYSTSAFDSSQFDAADQFVVAHDPLAIVQRAQIEGLLERNTYYLRIRVNDVLGRHSVASNAVLQESTGHYDLTGEVRAVEPSLPPRPLANVLVDVEGARVLTDATGGFGLLALPDLAPQSVTAVEQSGANYYVLQTSPLAPLTRDQPIVLFPQDIVQIEVGDAGVDPILSRLEYFRRMTFNFSFFPFETNPWQSYPIPFYVGEYISTGGADSVSYRQAFLDAIDIWNEAAGDSLFRPILGDVDPIADGSLVGGRFVADLPQSGSSLLGQVRVVRPVNGQLFEDVPEFLEVHMLKSFLNLEVATYVAVHELGHVLGLSHSPNLQDIMFRTVRTQRANALRPLDEEAFAVRLLKEIPAGTDLRWYSPSLAK